MIRKIVKRLFKLYDLKELQGWGHCGICGKPINSEVFEKVWAIGICEDCK